MDNNKRKQREAAALRFDMDNDAVPIIVAVGKNAVADKIVEKARENDVAIVEDSSLSKILGAMSVGDAIPRELYTVVAQILIFVGDLDQSYQKRSEYATPII